MAERLLDVKNLKTYFFTDEGVVRAVDGVDLYIDQGETLGVVGESGCGKSVTALSIMKLIPQPPGKIVEGQILLQRPRPRHPPREQAPEDPRQGNLDGLPGAHDLAQPGLHLRRADRRGAAPARGPRPPRRHGQDGRDAEAGAYPERRAPGQGIPAPALGRHAPARDDRHGAVVQPQPPHRRRAHDRPRRHHPGADPRAAERAQEPSSRWPSCSSPTTWGSSPRPRSAWSSCTRPRWPRKPRSGTCSRSRCTPTRRGSCGPSRGSISPPRNDPRLETIPGTVPTLRGDIAPGCRFAPRCPFVKSVCTEQDPVLKEVKPGHKVSCWLY